MDILRNSQKEIIFVFVAAFFLMISGIWLYPITILDEAKNAAAAREMFLGHSFYPTFNEILRSDKPPLHYVFMQLGYFIFGINELGARFFGSLLGAGFMAFFYQFLRNYASLNLARLSVFMLLSAFFWVQEFHLAVPDPYLLVFLCSAWLFFFKSSQEQGQKKRMNLLLFYLCVGFATLAKGPLAIVLTGLIGLLFLGFKKELSYKKMMKYAPIWGGLLILLVAAPWFIWMHFTSDAAFTQGFFVQHNFQRFGSEMEGHGGIFLITWAYVILGFFPFGSFFLQAIIHGWKFFKRSDLTAFSMIILVVVLLFFSISSTRLPNYTLPAIPFLAILTAGYFEEIMTYKTLLRWWNLVSIMLIVLVSFAIPIAVFNLFEHPVVNSNQLILTMIATLLVFPGILFIRKFYIQEKVSELIWSMGILWILIGIFIFYFIYPTLSQAEPVIQASEIMKNNEIVVYESYDPAFNFNYQQTFIEIHGEENLKQFIQENPDVLVLTKDRRIKDVPYIQENFQQIFNQPSLFENYRSVILKKW
ncbi:MAG: glycosyltransferase family 39 protein [Flavobacteriaceae bacterium]|nr:glycosyltransferase family 39 protein [Flavobacteriaceae bacterium]